ncbi:FadR/GntR family transcriptional regulator, partial [Corallococcus aberystwythensis]
PRNGGLRSERMMARHFGVCRGTVREALRRLAARGLVVLRPGRQARAVALDESLTLENLGLALHDTRTQECRRLLEGFFSLKRQVLVELLSDCCAHASDLDLQRLGETLYTLQDAARWYHPKERGAQLEFELLRLSAWAAARPGHLLLIQSLQRAFRGIADRLLPFMGGDAMRQWILCALDALYARDVQALQHQLPALMKTYDELVLNAFAPVPQEAAPPEAPHAQECSPGGPASDTAQDDALVAHPRVETRGSGATMSVTEGMEAFGETPRSPGDALPLETDSGVLLFPEAPQTTPCEPGGACTGRDLTDTTPSDLPDCRVGSDASSPDGSIQSEDPLTGSPQTHGAARNEGGPLHGAPPRGWWAARLWLLHGLRPRSPVS